MVHEVENLPDFFLLESLTGRGGVANPQRTVAASVQIGKEDGNIGRSGPINVECTLEVMVISHRILLEVSHQLVPSVMASVVLVGWPHDDAVFQQEDVQHDTVIVHGLLNALSYSVTGVETKDKLLAGARKRRLKQPSPVCVSSVKWERGHTRAKSRQVGEFLQEIWKRARKPRVAAVVDLGPRTRWVRIVQFDTQRNWLTKNRLTI